MNKPKSIAASKSHKVIKMWQSQKNNVENENEYSLFSPRNNIFIPDKQTNFNSNFGDVKYIFHCLSPNCNLIPKIKINSSKNTVKVECACHKSNAELDININEYLNKSSLNKAYSCACCGQSFSLNDKNKFYICLNCSENFCENCYIQHSNKNKNHKLLNIEKVNMICFQHNEIYNAYCFNCKKNICNKCYNKDNHNNHRIIYFDTIQPNSDLLERIKNNLLKEKSNLDFLEKNFLESLKTLKNSFYSLFKMKRDQYLLKEGLIKQYEHTPYNYHNITNCIKLNFFSNNITFYKQRSDVNKLQLISQIFNILNDENENEIKNTQSELKINKNIQNEFELYDDNIEKGLSTTNIKKQFNSLYEDSSKNNQINLCKENLLNKFDYDNFGNNSENNLEDDDQETYYYKNTSNKYYVAANKNNNNDNNINIDSDRCLIQVATTNYKTLSQSKNSRNDEETIPDIKKSKKIKNTEIKFELPKFKSKSNLQEDESSISISSIHEDKENNNGANSEIKNKSDGSPNLKKKDKKNRIYSINIPNEQVCCLLSLNNHEFLGVGLTSGSIKIFNQTNFNKKLEINEHMGAVYSLYETEIKNILSSSADRTIKLIKITDNYNNHEILYIFKGHKSSVFKAIELSNKQIISCSDDATMIIWGQKNENDILNSFISNNDSVPFESFVNHLNSNDYSYCTNNNNYGTAIVKIINTDEVVNDILQINDELLVSSTVYGCIKFWNIFDAVNSYTIKNIQCSDSHNNLCKINDRLIGVLLNEKYGFALIDVNKKEIIKKIMVSDNLEIKLSSILITYDNIIVIGGQNILNNKKNQIIYKFYKISKEGNKKMYIKLINTHCKNKHKRSIDDDIWLNDMIEGKNNSIINGFRGSYLSEDYGQIDIFFRGSKNKCHHKAVKSQKNIVVNMKFEEK